MRLILPRPFGRKAALFAVLLVFACEHPQAPVKPGEPIPAEQDVTVDTADTECDGLLVAFTLSLRCLIPWLSPSGLRNTPAKRPDQTKPPVVWRRRRQR